MRYFLSLMLAISYLSASSNNIDEEFVKRFSTLPTYSNPKISPDGKVISVVIRNQDKNALAFLKTDDFSLINILELKQEDEQVGDYIWASNKRIVLEIAYKVGSLEQPITRGELFSVNYDLSKPRYIYGYKFSSSNSKRLVIDQYSSASVIDPLIDDSEHVLVAASPFGTRGTLKLVRVNIFSGQQKLMGQAPPGSLGVLTDSSHTPRFAVGANTTELVTYIMDTTRDEWKELQRSDYLGDGKIIPLVFDNNESSVIVLDDTKTSTSQIKSINLNNSSEEILFHHPKFDPYPIVIEDRLVGVGVAPDLLKIYWLDDGIEAQIASQLFRVFNDGNDTFADKANVTIASISQDKQKVIAIVEDDSSSPTYWFLDRTTNRLINFLTVWPEISEKGLSPTKTFSFVNSDGITLYGYFTDARSTELKNKQPLIVLPHGGPIGPRDSWSFDPDVQILSNAGYAVMKVNYRGSGGYGKEFLKAGIGEPGGIIQQDIIEATEWVIEQGWVDKDRIGIYGGSFGGYSAVQAPILRPDLFKAGVSYVGIFDFNLDIEMSNCQGNSMCVSKVLKDQWGDSPEKRAKMSPVNYIEKLQAPILIVAGEEDTRCPPEQQYALEAALNKYSKDYKLIMVPKEGHGFINPENRFNFYIEMLEHFKKHL